MANKLNYDGKTLLNIKFSPSQKGYDALEVDQIFDSIIKDYETMSNEINELVTKNVKQQEKVNELKAELDRAKFEFASLKEKYEQLRKTSSVTGDNYELVNKVAAYERVLHRKGINLKKALSDPDNC